MAAALKLKQEKDAKDGKEKKENEDMADAVAVALYYGFILTGKVKKKK